MIHKIEIGVSSEIKDMISNLRIDITKGQGLIVGPAVAYLPDLRIKHPRWIDVACIGGAIASDMMVYHDQFHIYIYDRYRIRTVVYDDMEAYMANMPIHMQFAYDGIHILMTTESQKIWTSRKIYIDLGNADLYDPDDILEFKKVGFTIVPTNIIACNTPRAEQLMLVANGFYKDERKSPTKTIPLPQVSWIEAKNPIHFLHKDDAYGYLSNDYDLCFTVDGTEYRNMDHYLRSMMLPIRKNVDRIEIMRRGLWAKFSQNPPIWAELCYTGNAMIVFDNPNDSFWGIGENHLGHLLMRVRDSLRDLKDWLDQGNALYPFFG